MDDSAALVDSRGIRRRAVVRALVIVGVLVTVLLVAATLSWRADSRRVWELGVQAIETASTDARVRAEYGTLTLESIQSQRTRMRRGVGTVEAYARVSGTRAPAVVHFETIRNSTTDMQWQFLRLEVLKPGNRVGITVK